MGEEIKVRFAAPADLDFLLRHAHTPPEILRRKVEWREVFVAELEGGLVGSLHLEYLWSSVPYVALIQVTAAQRRRGVGRALLGFVESFLSERGHDALYSSSQVDEPEPQAWHRRMGFEECGVIARINDGVGELFFRKQLSPATVREIKSQF